VQIIYLIRTVVVTNHSIIMKETMIMIFMQSNYKIVPINYLYRSIARNDKAIETINTKDYNCEVIPSQLGSLS
jgi:hypothetical protein